MNVRLTKIVAVTSVAALLLGGGITPVVPLSMPVNAVMEAQSDVAQDVATDMKIFNEYGEDISINATEVLYNTECHQRNHEFTYEYPVTAVVGEKEYTIKEVGTEFTVVTDNMADGLIVAVNNTSKWIFPAKVTKNGGGAFTVRVITNRIAEYVSSTGRVTRKTSGSLETDEGVIKLGLGTVAEGLYKLTFTTKSGNVYRTLNVQVSSLLDLSKATVTADGATLVKNGEVSGLISIIGHPQQITVKASGSKYCTSKLKVVGGMDGSPTDKAEISSDGLLTPKKNGTCYIKVYYADGEEHYIYDSRTNTYSMIYPIYIPCTIVKDNPASSIEIINAPPVMYKGDKVALELVKTPTYTGDEYATSATDVIKWSTSDEKVLKVDENGVLTAVGSGEVTITAQGENAKVYSTKCITVIAKATSVKIKENPVSVTVGDTIDVTAVMTPTIANENIEWFSEDTSIATVSYDKNALGNSQTATIKGIKEGTVKIVARTESGKEFVATVTVTPKVKITSFKVTGDDKEIDNTLTLYTGSTVTLNGVSTFSDSTVNNEAEWSVTDENGNILYTESGTKLIVKGLSCGTATIKATSKVDSSYSKTINVKILRGADSITITNTDGKAVTNLNIVLNQNTQLKALVTVDGTNVNDHDDKVVSWASSDVSVISVTNNGLLVPHKIGTATITVTSASGMTKSVRVTVKAVSRVEIKGVTNGTVDIPLKQAEMTKQFTAVIYDENSKAMIGIEPTWTSSNERVATVDSNGKVTLHTSGKTTLTAKVGVKSSSVILSVQIPITNCEFNKVANQTYVPGKTSYAPNVVVKNNGVTLKNGIDYTVSYKSNTKVGSADAIITGIGAYSGSKTLSFKIVSKNIAANISVNGVQNKTYTGSAITQNPKVYNSNVLLNINTDYKISYKNNVNAGTATMTITGKGNYTGSYSKTFKINACAITSVTLSGTKFNYTGKAITPKVTVKAGNKTLSTSNYTVSYSNNVKVGTATVKVTGKGNYRGTISKTFKIMQQYPSKIIISKTEYNLGVGETCKFTASVSNAQYVKNNTLYWSSSNTRVATVDKNGKVTAKSRGTAYIKVRSANGKAYAQCKVTVKYAPSSIRITTPTPKQFKSRTVKNNSVTAITVKSGTTFQLVSAVNSGAVAHSRSWSVKNSSIVSISKNGFTCSFKANRTGTTYITVKTYNNKSATVKVTVVSSSSSQKMTISQANAVKMAKDYLSFMPFSRDGLVGQLKYEKFSDADAKYGADHCGANWNTQAQRMAKSYLSVMPFSRDGLVKQLKYEKFTDNQAEYGVNNCGANWNEQAVKMAKKYLSVMPFSREGLIDQLEFEGFTHAQAVYAVNKLGY